MKSKSKENNNNNNKKKNTNNNKNWLGFSLISHMNNMEGPSESAPSHFNYSSFYCEGENGGFHSLLPLKSDGSLCIMDPHSLPRSHPQGNLPHKLLCFILAFFWVSLFLLQKKIGLFYCLKG